MTQTLLFLILLVTLESLTPLGDNEMKLQDAIHILMKSENGRIAMQPKVMMRLAAMINLAFYIRPANFEVLVNALQSFLRKLHKPNTQASNKIENLIEELIPLFKTPEDFVTFKFLIEQIIIPINLLIEKAIIEVQIRTPLQTGDETGHITTIPTIHIRDVQSVRIYQSILDEMVKDGQIDDSERIYALNIFIHEYEQRIIRDF